jgi:hypothetical protein
VTADEVKLMTAEGSTVEDVRASKELCQHSSFHERTKALPNTETLVSISAGENT